MNIPVLDLHCDTALSLVGKGNGLKHRLRSNSLHIDLERAGGLAGYCQCFACFTTPYMVEWKQGTPEDVFEKEYMAVIHGHPEQDAGRLEDLLIRDKARRMTFVTAQMAKGVQPAALQYSVIRKTQEFSRVKIKLETGRTHQIRVHMSYIGHPVAGDPVYGRRDNRGLTGQALHAGELTLTHPSTKELMTFTAPLPEDFQNLLNMLE